MKKFLIPAVAVLGLLAFWSAALAQPPDPQDSVILESKGVATGLNDNTTPAFLMKVYVTNKDTLTGLTVSLYSVTVGGSGYAVVGDDGAGGRNDFLEVTNALNATLDRNTFINFAGYNETSSDSFLIYGSFSPTVLNPRARSEAPNAVRDDIWEIRFKQTTPDAGCVRFDSVTIGQPTGFAAIQWPGPVPTIVDVKVNFVAGCVDVGNTGGCGTCIPTGVIDINPGQRPTRYSLSQNYPNPFNANTQISFALPKAGRTTLEVFNILGQKVNSLVDEYMSAGNKIVTWDGRDASGREVPSGIYFYRLRSESFLQTKKMLMIQ